MKMVLGPKLQRLEEWLVVCDKFNDLRGGEPGPREPGGGVEVHAGWTVEVERATAVEVEQMHAQDPDWEEDSWIVSMSEESKTLRIRVPAAWDPEESEDPVRDLATCATEAIDDWLRDERETLREQLD